MRSSVSSILERCKMKLRFLIKGIMAPCLVLFILHLDLLDGVIMPLRSRRKYNERHRNIGSFDLRAENLKQVITKLRSFLQDKMVFISYQVFCYIDCWDKHNSSWITETNNKDSILFKSQIMHFSPQSFHYRKNHCIYSLSQTKIRNFQNISHHFDGGTSFGMSLRLERAIS